VELDHAPCADPQCLPEWSFSLEVPIGADAIVGPVPEGQWLSLGLSVVYPDGGDLYWSWLLPDQHPSECTTDFMSGVGAAWLAWAETFELGEMPSTLTDPLVSAEEGLDRLANHLDEAIASCPSMSSWEAAWDTFLGEDIDGRDASTFLEHRCASDDLAVTELCRSSSQ
jgi:hypothetical protein